MTVLIVNALFAYLLGSISGSLLVGKLRHVDIRQSGSGNAGGTNAFRTQGLRFALAVVVIDIGKGVVAAALPHFFVVPELHDGLPLLTQSVVCAGAAVFGHCYPIWHGFRGGKGAATAVGTLALLQPWTLPPLLAVWLIVLAATGWVGLATMSAGLSLVPAMLWLHAPAALFWYGVFVAAFLVFTHRGNIRNMRSGEEYRFEKARFRNWVR